MPRCDRLFDQYDKNGHWIPDIIQRFAIGQNVQVMEIPKMPDNEEDRLSEVRMFGILDTLPEKVYDDITFLAAQICGTPMSLINIIDHNRQWTKANFGHKNGDMPREIAFCSHTINEPSNLMEIQDTEKDGRFHDNPLIHDVPHIRFYAGATLISENGFPLGALCVIDQTPRQLTEYQKKALLALSRQVMSLLELRKKNNEIELMSQNLETASRVREDFFSSMSHEIRTPLNSINGISNILLQSNPRSDQVEVLQLLKFSSENLMYLINDVLDIGKLNAGKLVMETLDFNLREVLTNICQSFEIKAFEKGVEVHLEYDEELPEIFVGDQMRMAQIFNNLISNALKFTKHGEIEVKLTHKGFSKNKVGICVEVTDTGIGIKPEDLGRIFESFTQASEDITRLYGGTGLGLTITKNLIQAMGGELKVDSTYGKGSTFSFDVTLALGNPLKYESTANLKRTFIDLTDFRIRLLVAEDNMANQMIVGKFLSKWGITYDFAENGLIAVEMIKSGVYDAVLMDLHMPEMNGYEAVREIRKMQDPYFKEVPIVALTASALLDVEGKVIDVGMNDYVTKPFKPEELYDKITQYTLPAGSLTDFNELSSERFRPILMSLADDDTEFVQELARLFSLNYNELKEKAEGMIRNVDVEGWREASHKIKTSNQTLGLKNLEYHLNRIKNRMHRYDEAKATENIQLVRDTCDAIIEELSHFQKAN